MSFRNEIKHRINALDLIILRQRLDALMEHDVHAGEDGTYYVKSLYFDNYSNKALREKFDGVDKREKFRIRLYNDDTSFIRLEKKSKINGKCIKISAPLTKEECRKIIDNDGDFLLSSEHELLWELYAKMQFELLRPVNIVAYERESYIYGPGNVRVTLDTNIRGSYDVDSFLDSSTSMTQLYHTSILEVKWDEYLPDIIRNALQLKRRNSTSFSKYAAVRF